MEHFVGTGVVRVGRSHSGRPGMVAVPDIEPRSADQSGLVGVPGFVPADRGEGHIGAPNTLPIVVADVHSWR